MKLNCWLCRENYGPGSEYYINLSETKPIKHPETGTLQCPKNSFWIGGFCDSDFEKHTGIKLPPGGIMPIALCVQRRKVKKARKK